MINVVIVSIIVLATAENFLPFIIGLTQTPDQYVFLGTVHHPADYFYYLSQFAQGTYRLITTTNLFSGEQAAPTFVGWSNVLMGNIFHLVGLSPLMAYHTSIVILTIALLASGYRLALRISHDKRISTLTLYLFTLFHAFPVLREGKPSYGDYWNNFAVPRVRFGGVPHQLLLNTASFLLIYFVLEWINDKRTVKTLVGIGLTSLILASLQPVLWTLTTGVLLLTAGFFLLRRMKNLPANHLVPVFLTLSVTGIPPVIYLTKLFSTPPFLQLKLWEASQQIPLTPEHFISATGPIFIIAVLTLPLYLRGISFARLFVTLFSVVSLTLFLSPLPSFLGVSQVRTMSTLTILFLSCIASSGIYSFMKRHTKAAKALGAILIIGLSLIMLPNHIITMRIATVFARDNAYIYLPAAQYNFLRESGAVGQIDETYFVAWPYNELFPAVTGKRSYNGHPLITVNSREKDRLAAAILSGTVSAEETRAFFLENHIAYVIAPADNTYMAGLPYLTRKLASNSLILYEVR